MSLERVIKILEKFGFSKADAEVYIFLAKKGPKEDKDLAVALKMAKQQLYPILRRFKEKGVVTSSPNHPTLFSALDFEELLKLYIKLNEQKAQKIQETKNELLENWKNLKNHTNN